MKKIFKPSVMLNPVPVVLVTSKNKNGEENVFTVAWIGTVCTKPPMLSISIRPERLSYEYIKESMEFTVNLPSKNLVKEVDYCGVQSGRKEDKIKKMGFHLKQGEKVLSSYIEECPVALECKVTEIISLGTHHLFLAEILSCLVEESLIDKENKIHFEQANLMTYSHGEYFPSLKKSIGNFGFSVRKKKRKNTCILHKKGIK